MKNWRLWLRWSWRDLRARWLQVVAIALIIAFGTGMFAGLGGQKTWRIDSLNKSYTELGFFDLHIEMADGNFVENTGLQAALGGIESVEAVETRLVVPILVDASNADDTIVAKGTLVGVDVTHGGPFINQVFVPDGKGRTLTAEDVDQNVAVVEYKFAKENNLEPGDPIRISGDITLDLIGAGYSPEYFFIVADDGQFSTEADFAPLFMSLSTVQRLTGRDGLVNDAVFLLADGADLDAVSAEIERRMASEFPNTGFDLLAQEDDPARELMYKDAEGDQGTWDAVAFLFLIGAAFGAFNLAGRIVESQRRQIGIGMALGLPRLWIAFRPMLVGLQIAVLGTIFGLFIGLGLSYLFADLFKTLLPLPFWEISLYLPGFLQATLLGILLPFVATLIPVWRAVRVAPVDAIRSGYLVAKGGGLNGLLHILPLPGKSFAQMPFRNLFRSPWRSLLTVLGIAVAIVLMTAFIGFLDSFLATVDRAENFYLYQAEDRVLVNLDFFYPVDNGEISGIRALVDDSGAPLLDSVQTGLLVGGTLKHNGEEIITGLELLDFETAEWVPKLKDGDLSRNGIIIADKAAKDLGVRVGDTITLEHLKREGLMSFPLVETELEVVGIHKSPLRPLSYMHIGNADLMGIAGLTNYLVLDPVNGVEPDTVKLALLTQPGVASVQAIGSISDAIDEMVDLFVQILRVVQIIVLFMAFLIAFNSTSINVDERVREISTMFAFGLRIRTVTRMQMVENLIIGILGTMIGMGLGWAALNTMLVARVEDQMADLQLIVTVSPTTLGISALLGVLVVALVPLLSIRRMVKMNIPDTLRVME
ncbi:MAG: ABC transporter permease [Anaerolineae bacterium]|nr:ABC transporter permease [Anaerolineae bacterium]